MKKYLRLTIGPTTATDNIYVGKIHQSIEWVDNRKDATDDYRPTIEDTQRKLKDEFGLQTTLEEVTDARHMQSKWVICREDE